MKIQYPFFRDPDECTWAVIGEGAAEADLEGSYQKPYAILTQKRLYCKNDLGNFITENSDLRSAGVISVGRNWLAGIAFLCTAIMTAMNSICYRNSSIFQIIYGIYNHDAKITAFAVLSTMVRGACLLFPVFLEKKKKNKIAIAVTMLFVLYATAESTYFSIRYRQSYWTEIPYICNLLALWWAYKHREFQIQCARSSFSFDLAAYPAQELKQFTKAVKALPKSSK